MNTAAILKTLWPPLRRVLMRIGRWLLETLADEGLRGLTSYMRQRIKVFARRKARILARRKKRDRKRVVNWRVKWLTGRIARWKKALAWLASAAAKKLKGRVLQAAMDLAEQHVPQQVPEESFTRWRRLQRA